MQIEDAGARWLAAMLVLVLCGVTWAQEASAPATTSELAADAAPEKATVQSDAPDAAGPSASDVTQESKPYEATIPAPDQAAAEEVKRDPPRSTAVELEEIIVTATKREASSREIPATVNVIRGEDLEAIGAREMQDYLRLIPGITLQEGETNNSRTLSVRGIGPQPGANTTTGVLIDNVSMSDPYSSFLTPDLDPFDLRDLEVLKGPQGTLFGAGALNGAIRYVLNKPQPGVLEGKGFANSLRVTQGGNASTWGAALNVPLGDDAALRVVSVKQELPGLYDVVNANGRNDKDADKGDKEMARLMGLWKPTEALTVSAVYLTQDNYRDELGTANNLDGEFVRTNSPGPSTSAQAFDVANLEVNYDFDWATLVSETSRSKKFSDIDYDASTVIPFLATAGVETLRLRFTVDTEAISQELRLVSPPSDSPWVWIGGVYVSRYTADFGFNAYLANTAFLADLLGALAILNLPINPLSPLVPTPDGLSVQYIRYDPLEAQEEALFGELTRKFLDNRLEFTLGGRLYRQELRANVTVDGLLALYAQLLGFTGETKLESEGFSPKAAVKFQWTDDVLLYASAARGFQFGGLNAPAPIPTDNVYSLTYEPSTIWSYEVGLRTDWFHNTLQLDLTVFDIDWTDMQIRQGTPSGNTDYTDNISQARSKGVESSLRWLTPIPGLTLINTASYIRATVEEPYTTAEGINIPVGTELPAAPRLQTATTLAYTTYFGSLVAGANLTYAHIGEAFNNITHDTTIYDFSTLDAGIKLGAPEWKFSPELSFNVTNLTDESGLVGARITNLANLFEGELGNFLRPRAYALRISAQF